MRPTAAADAPSRSWRATPAGRRLLGADDLARSSSPVSAATAAERCATGRAPCSTWCGREGQDKRTTARMLSFGVNGLAIALMIVVFASHRRGSLAPRSASPAGRAVVGQKLLEAIFGDQAVRRLADAARADLERRAETLLATERARFTDRLDALAIQSGAGQALREALVWVGQAREQEAAE